MHEFELIKKYFSVISKKNKSALKLNDDVFFDKNKGLVISIDTYNEGNHFLNFNRPDLVIKKIIRSSISDSKSLNNEQKKFGIFLCGGDTTFSNKLSFTITSVGYSKNIIYRNKAKLNDDIYVTGNLGDSFLGLQVLKNKINFGKKINNYFINKYYLPDIQINLAKKLLNFANSSIDISDGLISDLDKMLNNQNYSYQIIEGKIPISKYLSELVKNRIFKKSQLISNGDDYQVLFTASRDKSRIIKNTSKFLGIKISKIGKIISGSKKSSIIDQKGKQIVIKNKGYIHQF